MSKSRNWVFTLNNYTPEDVASLASLPCSYVCAGEEVAQTGTPHLQGFMCFKNERVMPKKLLSRARFDYMKGTQDQAINYCFGLSEGKTPNEVVHEYGTRPKSSTQKGLDEKERWADIRKLALSGDFETLGEKYPKESILYDKNLERAYAKRPRELETIDGEMPHFWFYGAPGTGKSRDARARFPGAYIKNPNTKWWDGYDGEDFVIIDDFDKYQVSQGGDMKRWIDRYPFQAEAKGSQMMIRPKVIIVTSNYHPTEIWEDPVTIEAMKRRMTIELFGESAGPFAPCFKK